MIQGVWRLLREAPADGAANMACDEALLESVRRGAPPTLRLYAWMRPTLSLGAHQPGGDADLPACRRLGVDLVRRPTGGGAVLHDQEITYSVTGRLCEDPFPPSVVAVHERIAAALVAGLRLLAVPAEMAPSGYTGRAPADCFSRASRREVVVAGRKLAGSAQLRRRTAFLQHGSILLDFDADRLREVLRPARGEAIPGSPTHRPVSTPRPGLPIEAPESAGGSAPSIARAAVASHGSAPPATLRGCLGRPIEQEELEAALVTGFESTFSATLQPGALDPDEAVHAARLRTFKYLDALWTISGRVRSRL